VTSLGRNGAEPPTDPARRRPATARRRPSPPGSPRGSLGDVIELDVVPLVQPATLKETAKLIAAVDAVAAALDHRRRGGGRGEFHDTNRFLSSCWGSSAAL